MRSRRGDRLLTAFGRRLRASRLVAGYEDAADFARDLGLDNARYRRYERGEVMPPPEVLEDICKLTARSLDFLLLGKNAAPNTDD